MKNVIKALVFAILYFLAFFGIQLIVTIIFSAVSVMHYMSQNAGNVDYSVMTAKITSSLTDKANLIILISNILSLLTLFSIWLGGKKKLISAVCLRRVNARDLLFPALLGLSLYLVNTGLLSLLPIPKEVMDQYTLASNGLLSGSIIIQLLSVVIVAPIIEELVFRGLILKRLSRSMHPVIAAIISSLIFGVAHGNLLWMAYAFCLGLVMSYVCLKYKSVMASAATHMVFNLCGTIEGNTLKGLDSSSYIFIILLAVGLAASTLIIININKRNFSNNCAEAVTEVSQAEEAEMPSRETQEPLEQCEIQNTEKSEE